MKLTRVLLVLVLIGFAASVASADPVDPKITIGGGGSCESFSLTSLTQTFIGLQTGCMIDFTNDIRTADDSESGVFLTKIVVNVISPFDGPLGCVIGPNSPFNVPTVSSATSCTFSAVTEFSLLSFASPTLGLGPGGIFSLTFDPNFGSTVDVTLSQNVIAPEPASAFLLLMGGGAWLAFRKRRQAQA
jgi:hypothetical protein